jgi:putative DNA primase/helicase
VTAARIAAVLGGARRSGAWWRCRCPVHGSRGPTLALRDGERGLVAKCFAGCSRPDIFTELCRRGLLADDVGENAAVPDPAEIERRREADARDRERRIALARDIIASATPASGTVAERYLKSRVPGLVNLPQAIHYLPTTSPYARHPSGGRRPVMVAIVEHVEHGIVGAHRTWLAIDGSAKASLDPPRLSNGAIGGGAVRLAPATEKLLVGEGLETCLAAMVATCHPAWAALSTAGLCALTLPPLVRESVILADHDQNGAGERAAYAAADRWLAERRRVRLAMPSEPGTDFNDVLLGRSPARITESRDVAA